MMRKIVVTAALCVGLASVAQAQNRPAANGNALDLHVVEVREGVCATRANGQSVRLDNLSTLVEPVPREAQVRVHAPLDLSYNCVNGVVSSLRQRGFSHIAFVTEG